MRNHFACAVMLLALSGRGAERKFDFGEFPLDQSPAGFRSTVTGNGKPGDWKIILDDVPPLLPALTPQAPVVAKRAVLAQLAQDPTDEHFPLLIFGGETFADFTLTTRFKIVDGKKEQMAGLAFRIQDEKNYYYVRASALGNTFYFFKFVKGELMGPIGSRLEIAKGAWHEMKVECKGSEITCSLDGKVMIPQMEQNSFPRGKIGFWTKSDAVSYFADTKIVYTPVEVPAQVLVREMIKRYPRLLGLKIYVARGEAATTRLVASQNEKEIGEAGTRSEQEVIAKGLIYYGKEKGAVSVIMPLRDHNGDAIAAVRVVMKPLLGQTEENAVGRALPIVKGLQARVQSLDDLVQ